MKKLIPIAAIIIIVIVAAVVLTNKHSSDKNSNNVSSTSNSANVQSTPKQTNQSVNTITISNYSFNPADITVKKGTTLTWTNQDSVAHTITENDGKTGPHSQDIKQGQSYSFTYNTVGTFAYHCSVHPSMLGKVVVTE
jgi:plastocyanin